MRTLNISDEEMNDITKIVKPLEISCLLIKSVSVAIEYEAKEQKCKFLSMLLSILGVILLGNLLTSKCTVRAD